MLPARIREFTLENYKAFALTDRIELAPLTIVLGRNNAGKSALCRAPLFFLNALRRDAWTPFPLVLDGVHFGDRLEDVVFRRQASGFSGSFLLDVDGNSYQFSIGGTENYSFQAAGQGSFGQQMVTWLELAQSSQSTQRWKLPSPTVDWQSVRRQLDQFLGLRAVPEQIRLLSGLRATPMPSYRYVGGQPPDVGTTGSLTPSLLAHDFVAGGGRLLTSVNDWLGRNLQVQLRLASTGHNQFQLLAQSRGGSEANLADCGEGLGQILPVVVALTHLQDTGSPVGLYVIEQPEVHLHPFAHSAVAELFVAACQVPSSPWFLIETHSDNFLLRVRVAIAEDRLRRDAVRVYFVEDQGEEGSRVIPIQFDEQGTPDRWPKGVFAENLAEFRRLREAATRSVAKGSPK